MYQQLWAESVKAIPNLLITLLILFLGWGAGNRITARWDEHKKRRELDLQALGAFYSVYGQFTTVWKLWGGVCTEAAKDDGIRREVLEPAVRAEGELESLLVRISSERALSDLECTVLACFRQAFQSLRESITARDPLRSHVRDADTGQLVKIYWASSDSAPYLAFKALAGRVAGLLSESSLAGRPSNPHRALLKITDNRWEHTWVQETFKALDMRHLSPPTMS
ncbi:hypothetical protein ACFHYQ_05390 [Sphaerimonospora cavernae]|uniref:Uncharacterized protein n=1 Tax=Sphaerimonospora cavernae TaxID=1740611 RepID=A0ABV6U3J7_9ACTN